MCERFARHLSKVFIAQLCHDLGFQSIQESACEILGDVLQKYIEEVGLKSRQYAELACRTDSNYFDVKESLEEMGTSLADLQNFAIRTEEFPFAKSVPSFPYRKKKPEEPKPQTSDTSSKMEIDSEKSQQVPPEIPSFLAPFPEPHTYGKAPLIQPRETDPKQLHKFKNKEKRQRELSLSKLHESLMECKAKAATELLRSMPTLRPESSTVLAVAPTPLERDSPYYQNSIHKKRSDDKPDEARKIYTELEESERQKRRQRAQYVLGFDFHKEVEVPQEPTTGDVSKKQKVDHEVL